MDLFGGFALLAMVILMVISCSNPAGSVPCSVIFYDQNQNEITEWTKTVNSGTVIKLADQNLMLEQGLLKTDNTLAGWQISGRGKAYNGNFTVTDDVEFSPKWLEGDWTGIGSSKELVEKITDDPAGWYFLTADISLASYSSGWRPIGIEEGSNYTTFSFSGILEGNGSKVTGLTIKDSNQSYDDAGLFSVIDGGTVRNLSVVLAPAGIAGNNDNTGIGGITGRLDNGKIINCYVMGNITGYCGFTGGLAGEVNDSSISNCYSTGNISAGYDAGGIAGLVDSSNITNCYSTGIISSGRYTGGIIGKFTGTGEISGCAAINASINSDESAGRIVGSLDGADGQIIGNNFAWDYMPASIDVAFSGDADYDGIDTLIGEFKDKSTWDVLGFDFGYDDTAPWKMPATGYPVLYWQ